MTSQHQPLSANAHLGEMARHIDDLPLLPQVLVRILQLDPASDSYFEEFELMATEDPGFAVRVVSLANSASSAPVAPIETIRGALARLGAGTVAGFVASLSVQRVFVPREPSQIALWKHSIDTAVAAEGIAKLAPGLKVEPDKAYLFGLLHDIGRFVMLEHAAPELKEVEEHNWETPEELVEADLDVYTYTHSQLGYLACQRWGLSDRIADVVRAHHDDLPERIEPGSLHAEVLCIQIADRLNLLLDTEPADDDLEATVDALCLRSDTARAFMSASDICAEAAGMRSRAAQLFANLGIG